MERENKIKVLREQLLNGTNMTDEEYKQVPIDYCNEIDKGPFINRTKEIMEIAKKWHLI